MLCLLFVVILSAGCHRQPRAKPQAASSDSATPSATTDQPLDQRSPGSDAEDIQVAELASAAAVASPPAPEAAAGTENDGVSSPPPATPPVRLLVLMKSAPLLVDLVLECDGVPQPQRVDAAIAQVVAAVDADGDQEVTWHELATNSRFRQGGFGNPPVDSEDAMRQLRYRCDLNRNDRVDPNEVHLALSASGAPARWLRIVPDQTNDSDDMDLFDLLDSDGDGLLAADEWTSIASRLRTLDADDNATLVRRELQSLSATAAAPTRAPQRVIWLHAETDWPRTNVILQDQYAFGALLQAADLPDRPELFRAIDEDGDGSWNDREIAALASTSADIVLHLPLGATDLPVAVWESPTAPAVHGPKLTDDSGWQTQCWGELLRIERVPNGPDVLAAPAWQAAWQQADADQDGKLSEEEYDKLALLPTPIPLSLVDMNQDSVVELEELQLAEQLNTLTARTSLRLEVVVRPGRLWTLLDRNADGMLSERELTGANAQLEEHAGADAVLSPDELLPQLVVRCGRELDFQPRAAVSQTEADTVNGAAPVGDSWPAWWHYLDRNADGEVSRREFPGKRTQFDQLDLDSDGFLEIQEVVP